MPTTKRFAEFVIETKFEDIPQEAVRIAKESVLDCLGVALLASVQPIGRIVTEFVQDLGGNPQAGVIGSGVRTSAVNAAFANGTMAHGNDYDEIGHFAVWLLPTVLALGELFKLSGRRILEAYIIGHEVGTRINAFIGGDHYGRGWHVMSTTGPLGAAAAASKLLGLDTAQIRTAFGIAASQAGGVRQNFGTMTKPFHAGNAARSGIVAALLSKKGFTADKDIIEARFGYAACFGGEQCNVARMTENLGNPFRITFLGPGLTAGPRIKRWPCCGGIEPSLAAAFHLIEQHNISAEDVESVQVIRSGAVPGALIHHTPTTGMEGKFSMEFCVAAAFVDKRVTVDTFADQKASSPEIRDFMRKVHVSQHPDWQGLPQRVHEEDIFNKLVVRLQNGLEYSYEVAGWLEVPERAEVLAKYRENAGRVLTPEQIELSLGLIERLEDVEDIGELVDLVTMSRQKPQ